MHRIITVLLLMAFVVVYADENAKNSKRKGSDSGEEVYKKLSEIVRNSDKTEILEKLYKNINTINWTDTEKSEFEGHIRYIDPGENVIGGAGFFILREEMGEVFILAMPEKSTEPEKDIFFSHDELKEMVQHKMVFTVRIEKGQVGSDVYSYVKLIEKPYRHILDRLFFTAIILFLFFIMVGIGMKITPDEFILVFKYPRGIIIGPILQFGLLPLLALLLGVLAGFRESYPFIYAGIILVACSPGGIISNLMTYWGKGDLALSISMTAVTTVLSIFFTPFLLALYTHNLPEARIPVMVVFKQILVLVLIPLFIGMLIKSKAPAFAKKTEKFLSMLGIVALFFIIGAGVLDNLEKFMDTTRYGIKFHFVLLLLPLSGMIVSILCAKLLRINNFQTRAIGLETGIRNAVLAMTIAILLQDRVGDFYNSMLFATALYGLWMYPAGFGMIFLFKKLLPVR
jgi:BASS family bile acid:Na+ symporter